MAIDSLKANGAKKTVSDLYSQELTPKSQVQGAFPTSSQYRFLPDRSGGGGRDGVEGKPPVIETDPSALYMDEIQKAEHDKNYKVLLQSDIAAYNLKMNTQKYLNNSLAGQGLGTQGYGTSAHVGVENKATELYAQNLENYNQAESDALSAAQERQAQANTENDNQLVTFLQYSDGSEKSIDGYMDKYGYVKGNDGKWYQKGADGKADTTKPASNYVMAAVQSATENASANSTYGISKEESSKQADAFINAYGVQSTTNGVSIDDLGSLTVTAEDNKTTKPLSDVVSNELAYLKNNIKNYQDGTLIKLGRGSGSYEAYLFIYRDGEFYLVSNDDNEQEGGQVDARYNEYKGPKVSIVGK